MTNDSIVVEDPALLGDESPKQLVTPAAEEPVVPEKFKGKSTTEIIEMYQHLESEHGRRANEVGHLRKLSDELLGFARAGRTEQPANRPPPKTITADDLLNDPQGTITAEAKRAADERVADSESRVRALELTLAEEKFSKRHPGYKQTMEDAGFLKWVGDGEIRKTLALRAYNNDFAAADELFSLYEEYDKARKGTPPEDKTAAAKAAGLVKSGGSSAAGVVQKTSADGKKIWSRAELIKLRIENSDEFDRRWDEEFLPAYQEGRVR